jgi:phosphate butyryltransferase
MTLEEMLQTDRSCRVAIVQADHQESLKAMNTARSEDLAEFILIGDEKRIRKRAEEWSIPLEGVEFQQVDNDDTASAIAAELAERGETDAVMKGMVHTSTFTKALLNRERGLISPGGLISHVSIFDLPGLPHPFLLTDAAINIIPDLEQKTIILKNALTICYSLGIECPKAICVAPVEKVNPKIQSTVDADVLSKMDFGEAVIEGPLALDVALSREAAAVKGVESQGAGEPDILLFPELNSANGVYKALSFYPESRSAGILAGLKVPVVLTSRSDSEVARYLSLRLALASIKK